MIRPLHNRVIVQRLTSTQEKVGSLFIPEAAKEKPNEGEVVGVGPGRKTDAGEFIPVDVQVGDRILFGKYAGTDVKVNGVELLIVKEEEIMGVICGK